jgi:hypothetical protein
LQSAPPQDVCGSSPFLRSLQQGRLDPPNRNCDPPRCLPVHAGCDILPAPPCHSYKDRSLHLSIAQCLVPQTPDECVTTAVKPAVALHILIRLCGFQASLSHIASVPGQPGLHRETRRRRRKSREKRREKKEEWGEEGGSKREPSLGRGETDTVWQGKQREVAWSGRGWRKRVRQGPGVFQSNRGNKGTVLTCATPPRSLHEPEAASESCTQLQSLCAHSPAAPLHPPSPPPPTPLHSAASFLFSEKWPLKGHHGVRPSRPPSSALRWTASPPSSGSTSLLTVLQAGMGCAWPGLLGKCSGPSE